MSVSILKSKEDDSVNFVFGGSYPGFFEARYVKRPKKKETDPEYFAVYLSSQSGCRQACRMCHLTATKQTKSVNADLNNYLEQAKTVLEWYGQNTPRAEIVHFNFMARGEALANPLFLASGRELFEKLGAESLTRNLFPRFLISTIMPKSFAGKSLSNIFPIINPEIYYSIYSTDEAFRKKWLPNAMPVSEALKALKEYQENTKKIIKLHWCFIEGENDSEKSIVDLCHMVRMSGVRVDIAIVRYNPYSEKYGKETSEALIKRNEEILKMYMPFSKIKTISRVGFDVKASCGMFVEPQFNETAP